MVRQGGVIRLSVPIVGKPIPTCKWTKDGQDISHRAMIASYDDITELVIKEAHKDDSGTYDLVLENKCGRKVLYIKVSQPVSKRKSKTFIWLEPVDLHASAPPGEGHRSARHPRGSSGV